MVGSFPRMEIEAKFVVPSPSLARRLGALTHIADYTLGTPTRFIVRDTFFDTRANDLLSTRHVLRIRQRSDGKTFITFKAPAQKKAAIHRRPETEVEISASRAPRVLPLAQLPPRIKKLVAPLVHAGELYPMFSITQTRDIKLVRRKRRLIAEWSLDRVRFQSSTRKHTFYELEIELKKSGTEAELETITAWLELEHHLQPAHESKFARALAFFS